MTRTDPAILEHRRRVRIAERKLMWGPKGLAVTQARLVEDVAKKKVSKLDARLLLVFEVDDAVKAHNEKGGIQLESYNVLDRLRHTHFEGEDRGIVFGTHEQKDLCSLWVN